MHKVSGGGRSLGTSARVAVSLERLAALVPPPFDGFVAE
jgi:hypothetical protein